MAVDYWQTRKQSWLSWFFRGLLVVGFLVLIGRLVELQIVKGNYYRSVADENRVRRIAINAPRGNILARGGEVIVGSQAITRRVVFDPVSGYTKTNDLEGASQDETVVDYKRVYKLASAAGHIVGYLGEADKGEVGKIDPDCIAKGATTLGALIGRAGLEQVYNCSLSGTDGEKLVEVDSSGKIVRNMGSFDSVPGDDIRTTIHYGLQEKVGTLMEGVRGAIVVTDTGGEVLAMYSSPSYNPEVFLSGDASKIQEILDNPELSLFNRAVSGTFPPGSIFKPVIAIAALEEGKLDEDYTYTDTGSIDIDDFSYTNWYFTQYGKTEGEIGLEKAIARSTDTFFYKVGELLGIEAIADWSNNFGLGESTGIDLPAEVRGLVPTPDWKKKNKGERWYLGNTYHVSIGQGDLTVTPLEINQAISAIASGGKWCRPFIAQQLGENCREMKISPDSIEIVKSGMKKTCETGGTGFTFFDFKINEDVDEGEVACKTGTAETGREDKDHAWFVAFAPVDFPEIVVTVLVEEGGSGAYTAGPIAREIFDYWFHGESGNSFD